MEINEMAIISKEKMPIMRSACISYACYHSDREICSRKQAVFVIGALWPWSAEEACHHDDVEIPVNDWLKKLKLYSTYSYLASLKLR